MSNNKIFISFSGGRTSGFMAKWCIDNWKDDELVFIFANTGKEREETLEFINKCDKHFNMNLVWIEYDPQKEHGKKNWYKVVDFETASRNGEPFEKYIAKERIPNAAYPNCSGRLKSLPMHNFIKHELKWENYSTAIGIRYDERHRVNWETAKRENWIYPLITDIRVDKKYIRNWWDKQDFDLELKDYEGNCDMCWKKSKRKLMTLILEQPNLINWWDEMETKYGKGDYHFFRNNESAKDLIEEANNSVFNKVLDEHELDNMQCNLFSDLDIEGHCFCR